MANKKNDIKNQLDDLFKDKLQDRSFEFREEYWNDAEDLIEKYEAEARRRNRRRGFFLLWGLLFIIAAGSAALFFKAPHKQEAITQNTADPHIENKPGENSGVDSKIIDDAVQSDAISSGDSMHVPVQTKQLRSQPEQDNLIGKNSANTNNKDPQKTKDHSSQTSSAGNNSDQHNAQHQTDDQSNYTQSHKQESGNKTDDNSAGTTQENPVAQTDEEKEDNAMNSTSDEQQSGSGNNTQDESAGVQKGDEDANTGSDENLAETSEPDTGYTSQLKDSTLLTAQMDNPETGLDKKKNIGWHIGANYGFDYITKNISQQDQSYATSMAISKKAMSESPVVTFSGGITAGIDLHNFSISSGFQSYKFGEKFSYSYQESYLETDYLPFVDTSYMYLIDSIVIDSILDTIGSYTYIYDFDTTSVLPVYTPTDSLIILTQYLDSTAIRRDTNLLSYFEIPLLFGYSIDRNKWHFNVITGPSLGIYRFSSVKSKNFDAFVGNSADSTTTVFTNTTFNWLLAPSVGYSLYDNLEIQLQPWIRWNLNSAIENEDYKLRYRSYGLHLALEYHF